MTDFKNFTLLIVDDDEDLREMLFWAFKKQGFNVLQAESGDDGFKVFQENKIDLILSDMRMPEGDGLSLLERVRKSHPALPILIFLTGFSEVSVEECLAKGAHNVYSKPFNHKELVKSVMACLSTTTAA